MKFYNFIPKVCKEGEDGKPPRFSGSISVQIPMFEERYKLIEESGLEIDAAGNARSLMQKLGPVVKIAIAASRLVKEVNLKKNPEAEGEEAVEYKSFDDLCSDPDCDGILFEFGGLVMNGFRASKN